MKKGFTLVEIIISISLILIIGVSSVVSFNVIKKGNKEKTLNEMSPEILTALRLYIETNNEAKSKIYEDYEGMVITLNTLESEGLIDFQNIDVSDGEDYVVAMLSSDSGCSDILTVESWNLTNGPLNICLKSSDSVQIDSLLKRIEVLETKLSNNEYIYKGKDPLNYVVFNVTSSAYYVSWPEDADQDLWRIYSDSKDGLRLIYNKPVYVDRTKVKNNCSTTKPNCCAYSNVENGTADVAYSWYMGATSGLSYEELSQNFNQTSNNYSNRTAKWYLYNYISKKNYIDTTTFYLTYDDGFGYTQMNLKLDVSVIDKLGAINYSQLEEARGSDGNYLRTLSTEDGEMYIGTSSAGMSKTQLIVSDYSSSDNIGAISEYETASCQKYAVAPYVPFIKLKSNIKIASYDNCSDGTIRGSKNCPYELKEV